MSFSLDGAILVSDGWDGMLKLWSVPEHKEIGVLSQGEAASFAPDSRILEGI